MKGGPGWLMHTINESFHQEPFALLGHGLLWSFILVLLSPLVGGFLLFLTGIRLVLYLVGWSKRRINHINTNKAVIITGCDTGFGHELAIQLARNGFHVFAGCLNKDKSSPQFQDHQSGSICPIQLDVTSDKDVQESVKVVSLWLSESPDRSIHALVNNAGIGITGLVDWCSMDDFKLCMEVNFFGPVRMVKAYMTLLKQHRGRVVNVTSTAGLYPFRDGSPYFSSKHAAEAFSNSLRLELRDFGIRVITINPSFHDTPMVSTMGDEFQKVIDKLDPKVREEEYGKEYCERSHFWMDVMPRMVTWHSRMVVNALMDAVELVSPPPRMLVGIDAKFPLMVTRMLPVWLPDLMVYRATPKSCASSKKKID